ncbi:PREDICTED: LIM domain only protein 3-like [Priapulus caudatus]|uniref:LIM domain only protein 3-like n=1 Tax=Priapulus caudatus TaxID=37621 RepID=A0ABM1EAM5_PRICU|nr:PREDICTED: LIM domain only protein 3-like [Priapulus caudatus]
MIPAFEMVMRAGGNVYHLECFACQQCKHRFCVGDRFYLRDNQILCECDYEECVLFSNVPVCSYAPTHAKPTARYPPPHRGAGIEDAASSGYGSPDSL